MPVKSQVGYGNQDEHLSMTPVKTSNDALLPSKTAKYMVIAQLISLDLPANHLRQWA